MESVRSVLVDSYSIRLNASFRLQLSHLGRSIAQRLPEDVQRPPGNATKQGKHRMLRCGTKTHYALGLQSNKTGVKRELSLRTEAGSSN